MTTAEEMTDKELKDYDYNPQICKIGTLYFKDNFFVILKSDGSVDFRSREDDMKSLGTAKSITELKSLEKTNYLMFMMMEWVLWSLQR